MILATATATGVYLHALPPPRPIQISRMVEPGIAEDHVRHCITHHRPIDPQTRAAVRSHAH
jgi:hypothetical protein